MDFVKAVDKRMHPLEFFDLCYELEGKVHSVKINSLYHFYACSFPDTFDRYYNQTLPDLFLDIKLYDTPNTVKETLRNIHKVFKYVTIVIRDNYESIKPAIDTAFEKHITPFFVNKLTSSVSTSPSTEELDEFDKWCFKLSDFSNRIGVVAPFPFINIARRYNFKHILTPGVYITQPQSGQKSLIRLEELKKYNPDLVVVGRGFN